MSLWPQKKYATLTDLVHACQRQDPRAQTHLYDRYKGRFMGICLRYARSLAEAEDIFQESFLRVFAGIGEIKTPEAMDAWVKSVVVRTALNYYHRTTLLELKNEPLEGLRTEPENRGEYENIIGRLDMETLLGIINRLPDGYRLIINLHLIDGYTHSEIATLLSIADSTSRTQYMRGRNLLMTKLKELGITCHETY
jgi:RNA polymerase sigma factor (sigma-70 family)